jgi:hypothetical protein
MSQLIVRAGEFTFKARFEELAGNHFITLTSGLENLTAFGKTVLWQGAQTIHFEEI